MYINRWLKKAGKSWEAGTKSPHAMWIPVASAPLIFGCSSGSVCSSNFHGHWKILGNIYPAPKLGCSGVDSPSASSVKGGEVRLCVCLLAGALDSKWTMKGH